MASTNRFSIDAVFRAVDRVSLPVSRMGNRVSQLTRRFQNGLRAVDRGLGKVTSGLKRMGTVGVVAFVAIAAAAKNVIDVGANFGRQLGFAAAKFDVDRGTEAFERLGRAARKIGLETEFTATQAAGGLKQMASSGFSAEFAIGKLAEIVDFATVAEEDFTATTIVAVDALGSFGLRTRDAIQNGKELTRVMNVLTVAANSGTTTISQLSEAITKGAPGAVLAGVDMEEFAATLVVLANSGMKASIAGVAMKNITLAMAGQGNQAAEAFAALNIPLAEMEGNLRNVRNIVDIFTDLQAALAGKGTLDITAFTNAIFGKIGLPAASKLIEQGPQELERLIPKLRDVTGAMQTMAEFIRDDTKGSLDKLISAVEGVKLSIFELEKGPLRDVIDQGTEWIRVNEKVVAQNIAGFFVGVAKAIGLIVVHRVGILRVVAAFTALVVVLKVLTGVLTVIAILANINLISLIVIAVLALAAAVTFLIFRWKEVVTWFRESAIWVKVLIGLIALMLGPLVALSALAAVIISNWSGIKAFFKDIFEAIAEFAIAEFSTLLDVINQVLAAARSVRGGIALSDFFGGPASSIASPEPQGSAVGRRDTAEVTIRTAEGAEAEVTSGSLGPGLNLLQTGAF